MNRRHFRFEGSSDHAWTTCNAGPTPPATSIVASGFKAVAYESGSGSHILQFYLHISKNIFGVTWTYESFGTSLSNAKI